MTALEVKRCAWIFTCHSTLKVNHELNKLKLVWYPLSESSFLPYVLLAIFIFICMCVYFSLVLIIVNDVLLLGFNGS